MLYVFAALAALMGAAGVASSAAAAHSAADPRLSTMAQMLMIHAAAITGLLGLGRGAQGETPYIVAAGMMTCGMLLFAGDLAARIYLGGRLFPFAAPIGGSLTIAAWLAAAVAAFIALAKR